MPSAFIATMFGLLAVAPLPMPKGNFPSLKDLEGVWEIERYEIGTPDGLYEPEALYPRFVIRNGKWWKERDLLGEVVRSLEFFVEIDATKSPPWFDDKRALADKAVRAKGIYRLSGDRLTIVFTLGAADRPTHADIALADGWQRFILRRRK